MLGWAALNEPPIFDAASLGVWALSALTVGLLAYAAVALARPVLGLAAAFFLQGAVPQHDEANEP
jgi:apolipoprotein N-acyltransferase